jgi:hypothetical protein
VDPEELGPVVLAFFGIVGAAVRRLRTADTSTVGQSLGSAGGVTALRAAAAFRWGGRCTVDVASEAVAVAGTVVSGIAGLVVDGANLTIGAAASPVVSRVTGALFPGGDKSAIEPVALEPATEVVAGARGKRFHRPMCPLAPEGGLSFAREAAVATGRRPCPTCQP